MSSITISIIIDKKAKSVKLINNRPGYDMKYLGAYIVNYYYGTDINKIIEIEKQYGPFAVKKGVTAGKFFFWVNTISGHISA